MEPEETKTPACVDCTHEHAADAACAAEGCTCGADAAPAAEATPAAE